MAIQSRWQAVRDRLHELPLHVPPHCPEGGFIDSMPDYKSQFGIWLMPDCRTSEQKLEDLVATLIPEGHPLWAMAKQQTEVAAQTFDESHWKSGGSGPGRFRAVDLLKAQLHCWLAWQDEPGLPFGAAVNNRILGHDSTGALNFMDWLRRLYSLQVPN